MVLALHLPGRLTAPGNLIQLQVPQTSRAVLVFANLSGREFCHIVMLLYPVTSRWQCPPALHHLSQRERMVLRGPLWNFQERSHPLLSSLSPPLPHSAAWGPGGRSSRWSQGQAAADLVWMPELLPGNLRRGSLGLSMGNSWEPDEAWGIRHGAGPEPCWNLPHLQPRQPQPMSFWGRGRLQSQQPRMQW